ncbi:MAG: 2-amino-4-hydroxy-6-hydroxymethyldihydropteridine diphosphokinase [SAR202 cluster bacterium Io17-Chloro-G2]|nr:MAG: 2-amino-4-hydroxy-6-hydroxymethyldihydropteridine diphosphokinase [SAR202 cluster bacterium Io17-Chloro-G2]
MTVYLGLGSNLGCRERNLAECVRRLSGQPPVSQPPVRPDSPPAHESLLKSGDLRLVRSSDVYETEPWGFADQRPFLNLVLEISTGVPPQQLLAGVKELETMLGRLPTPRTEERYGPRLIDIDILLYGSEIVDLPGLQVPHPRLHQRAFVLVPMAEIAQELIHPVLGISIGDLAGRVDGKDGVKKWSGQG